MHWPDPGQRERIAEISDNLTARIAEADREGWLGEAEGLKISRAGAEDKLAQIDRRTRTPGAVGLGMPAPNTDYVHRIAQVEIATRRAQIVVLWKIRIQDDQAG